MENLNNQRPPKTWLVESILSTVLCCLPFGIAGIVNAAKVESRFYAGDIEGAERASKEAKKWTIVSAVVAVSFAFLYVILIVIGVASSQF
ncbi:CD225/dispanin family protein [Leeuwenhoekiella polynyae]|uniref:Interferon-induced transmembrane protein n=1 Tax=Leeuwenhoekiella polynyae TaxID=1550906 RepID=A0A4Q0P1S1_9FLAO|nr:CD225/dispanin family protein [Leeuwenhoekiella polynyae]RXG20125.1 interferon-induced transmembrane protein [Leeuwenhoekiella polynyae]